jgi:hypothetical protein
MRLTDLDGTARAFAQIDKPHQLLASLAGPSSAAQSALDRRAKLDRVFGLGKPTLLEQIVTGQTRHDRLLRTVMEPTAVERVMGLVDRTDRLVSSSVLDQLIRQQRIFDGLTRRTTLLQALVTGPTSLPSELLGQAERYREDLQDEVAEIAAELPTAMPDVLDRLADEREAILICLKRIGQIGVAAACFGVKIPPTILGLVMVFYILGEVADEILGERADDEAHAA